MIKKLLNATFWFLIILSGYRYLSNKTQFYPYPYIVEQTSVLEKQAPILMIGDRGAKQLSAYVPDMKRIISKELENEIDIQIYHNDYMEFHRIHHLVKSMEKKPKVIVIWAGTSESSELKFNLESMDDYTKNLKRYQNIYFQTMMSLFPKSSRLIYTPYEKKNLGLKPKLDKTNYSKKDLQKRNQFTFDLFNEEVKNFFEYLNEQKIITIVVAPFINIDMPPKLNCNLIKADSKLELEEIKGKFKNNELKEAVKLLEDFILRNPTNVYSYYIYGQVLKKAGENKKAFEYLEKAATYDCELKRGHPVIDSIIRKHALDYKLIYFNTNAMLYSDWKKNILVSDDFNIQNFYVEKISVDISHKIKNLLGI